MRVKDGVTLKTLRPEMRRLEKQIDQVYNAHGLICTVTSTNDGRHHPHSLHYRDAAMDLRVKVLSTGKAQTEFTSELRAVINEAYPGAYDVLIEDAGGPNAHIHIEFSPTLVAEVLTPKPTEA